MFKSTKIRNCFLWLSAPDLPVKLLMTLGISGHRGALRLQEQVHLLRCLQGGVQHDAYGVDEEEFVEPLSFRI